MDWLIEIGFVLLFLIVVIWLILRDESHRHSAKKADTASAATTVMPTLLRDIRSLQKMTPMIDMPNTHRITNIMIRILHQAHILITTAIVVAAMTAVEIAVAETVEVAGIRLHSANTKKGCTHYCVNTIRIQPFAVL